MKKQTKTGTKLNLKLKTQTVRPLTSDVLATAAGGAPTVSATCSFDSC